jgi:hypothetical protein
MTKLKFKIKYLIQSLYFIKSLWSPFKPFKLKWYIGKTAIGTPYFYPRKLKNNKFVPKKVGFDFVSLGYKTKWTNTDYRFEWAPRISFVFFGYQIAATVITVNCDKYWEAWLYYENHTNKKKSKKERIDQCRKKFSQTYISYYPDGREEIIDYYNLILRKKYK